MSNPWFRLYAEILNDPKVQILTESLRWRYVALLCLQCNESLQNTPDDEIALALRVTVEDWSLTKQELIKRRLMLKDGTLNGWEKRQYISDVKDPTAATRQQRYRDNKKSQRNDTVTSRLPDADTDTDNKKKETLSGKPDPAPVVLKNGKQKFKDEAVTLIEFLNEKAGRSYRPVAVNLEMIAARLAEGATLQDCKCVIAKKAREWNGDEKMEPYLRPATLFNRTKFAQYVGELGVDQ